MYCAFVATNADAGLGLDPVRQSHSHQVNPLWPAHLFIFACFLLVAMALAQGEPTDAKRPNFLVIVADDLGYGDIAAFRTDGPPSPQERSSGSRLPPILTPNLDRLAKEGLRLDHFYANDSTCSPTRAALLTGRYQHRAGVVNVTVQTTVAYRQAFPDDPEPFRGLPPDEITIAEVLARNGYRTALIGKWHLGPLDTPGFHPMDQGFEHFYGVAGWAGNMFSMKKDGVSYLWSGRFLADAPGDYWTYVQADATLDFIGRDDERPFFVYLAFNAPHSSSRIGPGDGEAANQWDHKASFRTDYPRIHKELVEALDEAVGTIVEGLREEGLLENTFILFTSDNGQNGYGYPPLNQHQGKQTVYEGGIRVPGIAFWPGTIEAGRVSDTPLMTMDVMPTLIGLAGINPAPDDPPMDGVDLSDFLVQGTALESRTLYWERPYQVWMKNFANRLAAAREDRWKLVRSHIDRPFELYDVVADPAETMNLADEYPDLTARLAAQHEQWEEMVYAEAPFDMVTFIKRLREIGVVTDESTAEVVDKY